MIVNKLKLLIVVILLSLFLYPSSLIYADENLDLPTTRINPGNFYYNLKRLWEKGIGNLQFSKQSRITFLKSLLKTRLAELAYVVDKKLLSEVQQSTERFSYQAGILSDKLVSQGKPEDKKKVIEDFGRYAKFLEKLRDKYPANSSFWMLVQHDINTLNILSEQLK